MATPDQPDKRRVILNAATLVFSEKGFVGANLDEVVAAAAVSKQTLYKLFADKASLFRAIVPNIGNLVDEQFQQLPNPDEIGNIEEWIHTLALRWVRVIMDPEVQRIRRLVIAEAPRFPDVANDYWESGFQRVFNTMAEHFRQLHEAGLLYAPDPLTATGHFAGLLLWVPSNRTMFSGHPDILTDEDLQHYARAGADAFLRAYLPHNAVIPHPARVS